MCTPPACLTQCTLPLQVTPEEVMPTPPEEEVTGSKGTVKVMPFGGYEHKHFTTELALTDKKAARAAQWASKCRCSAFGMPMGSKTAASLVALTGETVTKAKSSEHLDQVTMPTVAKKMAESKVSLNADAVPVRSVLLSHAAHSRLSIPCPIHRRAVELAVHMTLLLTPCVGMIGTPTLTSALSLAL